jgi:hypothetical protein
MVKVLMFYHIAIKSYEGSKLLKMRIFANIIRLPEIQWLKAWG